MSDGCSHVWLPPGSGCTSCRRREGEKMAGRSGRSGGGGQGSMEVMRWVDETSGGTSVDIG